MRNILGCVTVVWATLFSTSVFADGYVRLDALYLSQESGTATTSKTSRTLLDIGGGYAWPSGFTLGALYGTEKIKNDSSSSDRTSVGPTIGWYQKDQGPFILGTYFFTSELDDYKGSGYEVDLGYKFKVSAFSIGLQLSYKHFSYDKNGSASVNPAYVQNYIDPYFAFWFEI